MRVHAGQKKRKAAPQKAQGWKRLPVLPVRRKVKSVGGLRKRLGCRETARGKLGASERRGQIRQVCRSEPVDIYFLLELRKRAKKHRQAEREREKRVARGGKSRKTKGKAEEDKYELLLHDDSFGLKAIDYLTRKNPK